MLFAKIKGKSKTIFGLRATRSLQLHVLDFLCPYIRNLLGISRNSNKRSLKNEFIKKILKFVKSKIITTKNGKILVKILKTRDSFRIKSFIQSKYWVLLPAGKSRFKKLKLLIVSQSSNKIIL